MEGLKKEGAVFPTVPFSMVVLCEDYASRYCLPYKVSLIVTHVRYSVREKHIRYSVANALFDFPWDEDSCEIMDLCFVN